MKRWLHWLLRIENNMSPFSIKHHTSWNESESFESQFTVFFTYKITVCWVGTSKVGRINCIELTGNWENNISIFSEMVILILYSAILLYLVFWDFSFANTIRLNSLLFGLKMYKEIPELDFWKKILQKEYKAYVIN